MSNTEERKCENCIWEDWCEIHNPNSELCGVYGNEVAYKNTLKGQAEVYFEEILEYDDGRIEMF